MTTHLTNETRERVGRDLAGEDSLADLRSWIREHALTVVEDEGDTDDEQLIYGVELVLSEREHGDWTEDEVRCQLRDLLSASTTIRTS